MNWLDAPTHDGDWLVQYPSRYGEAVRAVMGVWISDGEVVPAGIYTQNRSGGICALGLRPGSKWLEIEWPEVA